MILAFEDKRLRSFPEEVERLIKQSLGEWHRGVRIGMWGNGCFDHMEAKAAVCLKKLPLQQAQTNDEAAKRDSEEKGSHGLLLSKVIRE